MQAHHDVAGEAAEALVEVVRAAQQGAHRQRAARPPAELGQPVEQVAGDEDLLQHAVLRGRQDQHRDAPPDGRQRAGTTVRLAPAW